MIHIHRGKQKAEKMKKKKELDWISLSGYKLMDVDSVFWLINWLIEKTSQYQEVPSFFSSLFLIVLICLF